MSIGSAGHETRNTPHEADFCPPVCFQCGEWVFSGQTHVSETINHDPEELLATYAQQQSEIQSLRDQLKSILSEALSR